MDEFYKDELSPKEERLRKKIQEQIHYCYNCQARDSGEWIWVLGERYDIEDLFDDFNLTEGSRDRIVDHLNCLRCGTSLDRYVEIGLEETTNIEIKDHIKLAKKKYLNRLINLAYGIKDYPTLSLSLPLGKSIYKEIKSYKLPECSIEGIFYRARKLNNSQPLKSKDFLSPPLGKSDEGRFNHAGQSHFYLSDSEETAVRETLEKDEPSLIWIQKFELKEIRKVLDLSYDWDRLGPSTSALLVALHESSVLELSKNNKEKWKPDYCLTRFIMDCAKKSGYSGIRYNSTKDPQSKNIVLFQCKKRMFNSLDKPKVVIFNPKPTNLVYPPFF